MQAAVLHAPGTALMLEEWPLPRPGPGELLIEVSACGVCRTDLHIVDGEVPANCPVVPGHQIVGRVIAAGVGALVPSAAPGQRVGVPWLAQTCGLCGYCQSGRENLCGTARFTGCDRDGGFAQYALATADYCLPLPADLPDLTAAPLLCAGLIGHRAYRLAGAAPRLGLYGFGAAAHIIIQVARYEGREVYAFTRPGDQPAQTLARELGACWAGGSDAPPPQELDAAIIFAPVGALVPAALAATARGGTVICAGIHMSTIPAMPYALLWGERRLQSVAHLTRADGLAFLPLAARIPIRTHAQIYPLAQVNRALDDLRAGRVTGCAVLHMA